MGGKWRIYKDSLAKTKMKIRDQNEGRYDRKEGLGIERKKEKKKKDNKEEKMKEDKTK